jgi:hypothetical protein
MSSESDRWLIDRGIRSYLEKFNDYFVVGREGPDAFDQHLFNRAHDAQLD